MLDKKKVLLHYLLVIGVSFVFAFVTILIASTVTSFLYPRPTNSTHIHDGMMFYMMGNALLKGYTPYIEVYDHKGLYIFYYTMLSAVMGRFGVFIVQVLLVTVTNVFIYKTMELHTNRLLLILSPIIVFNALFAINQQMPYDTDLETPFNAIMIFSYLKGLKEDNDKDFLLGNIFLGISAGIAVNLRLTDAILPLAFVIYFATRYFMRKKVGFVFANAGVVLGAMAVMTIIPVTHALIGGFMEDMLKAVYLNNFKYMELSKPELAMDKVLINIYVFALMVVFTLLIVFKRKEFTKDQIIFTAITFLIPGIFEVAIARYAHYILLLEPYYAVMLFYLLLPYFNNEKHQALFERISFAASSVLLIGMYLINPISYIGYYETDEIDIKYVNDTISDESKDGHTLVFGMPAMYLNANIAIGYGDFAAQEHHVYMSDRFSKEAMIEYLESEDSHYVITCPEKLTFVQSILSDVTSIYQVLPRPEGASIYIYQHM